MKDRSYSKQLHSHYGQNDSNNSEKDLYFSGVYPDIHEKHKRENMPANVRRDFEPFHDFLERSIKSKEKSSVVGAEFIIPERTISLELRDAVIKINDLQVSSFKIPLPKKNIFLLEIENEFDIDIAEVTIGRKDVVWKKGDYIQNYEGKTFIEVNASCDIHENQKVKIWLNDGDDKNATLKKIDYSQVDAYRIDTDDGCEIQKIIQNENALIVAYSGNIPSSVTIFGEKFTVDSKTAARREFAKSHIEAKNVSGKIFGIKVVDEKEKIIVLKNASEKETRNCKIKIDNEDKKFDILANDEISKLINSTAVKFSAGIFSCTEKDFENYQNSNPNLSFRKTQNQKRSEKRKLKKDGKLVGTIIELLEDDNFKNEVYSNIDMFFAESTIKLTDDPDSKNKKRTEYEIGWQDASNNLMEIAEIDGKKLKSIDINNMPPKLYVVADVSQLIKQKMALQKLMRKPMPSHKYLLELTEMQNFADWQDFAFQEISKWYRLTDDSREGAEQQREFVKKALYTPDFAFLDGPPGSGKTTTILEIIAQAVMAGQKVMLAASTNAAVDNILERLTDLPEEVQNKILAVRIGRKDAISDTVNAYNIYNVSDTELQDEIVRRANLVCSTIFGILQHPNFKLQNKIQPAIPIYDYLIIDEASKTTFQDFIVPALYAKKWILSGDLKQLTPYTEQDSLVNALRANPHFSEAHQYVQALLVFLKKQKDILKDVRFCIPCSKNIAGAAADLKNEFPELKIAVLTTEEKENCVTKQKFLNGESSAAYIWGCKILFVEENVFSSVEKCLPKDFMPILSSEIHAYAAAQNKVFYKNKNISINKHDCKNCDEVRGKFDEQMKEHTWANEIVWRLCRMQELFQEDESKVKYLKDEIQKYIPEFKKENLEKEIAMIKSMALPSVLQLLQEGVAKEVVKNKKPTALNQGFSKEKFNARHTILEYQHRMHPDISEFSKEHIYNGEALLNPKCMEEMREWECHLWKTRNVWLDIKANSDCKSDNRFEAVKIKNELEKFMNWTKSNPNPNDGGNWSVAVLTYYRGQERRLKSEIKTLFGEQRERSFYKDDSKHIEVKIFTVDKFQGQEADVVFISFVKSAKNNANVVPLGFMDSQNRLNVALTRARYQRIIVGDMHYFKENRRSTEFLKNLADSCQKVSTR